ncbi:unnamed protein product [Angiostrongylus costaricensis]|uniref:ZP domain-containing protein n=1 Tax=Angiostrongylus costaricensis TaxID=334426 RepID=A0A158PGZ4_ANGCS|nr:unnamed protein product [Angiostrongylus costaricensis]
MSDVLQDDRRPDGQNSSQRALKKDVMLDESLERAEPTGLLMHATGKNGRFTGALDSLDDQRDYIRVGFELLIVLMGQGVIRVPVGVKFNCQPPSSLFQPQDEDDKMGHPITLDCQSSSVRSINNAKLHNAIFSDSQRKWNVRDSNGNTVMPYIITGEYGIWNGL